jgi:hypothetical protein
VGFVVDKVALGQVFSECFVFSANSHSTDSSTLIIYRPGLVQYASSGRRTKWTQSHPTPRNYMKTVFNDPFIYGATDMLRTLYDTFHSVIFIKKFMCV